MLNHSSEGLSDLFRGPAVIFTGHPSLELGEARGWAVKWSQKDQNKILIAEPDLPSALFRDRKNVHYAPIDTRLTQGGARMLMDEIRPKELIISHKLASTMPKLVELTDIKVTQIAPYKTYSCGVDSKASVSVTVRHKIFEKYYLFNI